MVALSHKRFTANLKGSLKEAFEIVAQYPERFKNKTLSGKALSLGKLSLLPLSVYLSPNASTAVHTLGVVDLAGVFIMQRMRLNSHFNAFAVPLGGLLVAQQMLLGAYGYAFMVGVVGLRNTAMASLPDTKEAEKQRLKISFGLAGLNMAALGAIGITYDSRVLLLAAGVLTGALATSMVNSKSHIARALRFPNYINGMLYSYFVTGSASQTISSAMSALNCSITIAENDIPVSNKSGKSLSLPHKIKSYVSTLLDSDKRQIFKFKNPAI
jgi:hypothetical protein